MLAASLAIAIALATASGAGVARGSGIGSLRQGIAGDSAREHLLARNIDTVSKVLALLERQLSVLNARVDAVQAQLDADEARLGRLSSGVVGEEVHVSVLRRRFGIDERALRSWLVSSYENGQPNVVDVIFSSSGFSQLLERLDFLHRTAQQVGDITARVHAERDASTVGLRVLRRLQVEQAHTTAATKVLQHALSSIQAQLASRQAALARARELQMDALAQTHAHQAGLQHQLDHAIAVQRARELAAQLAALAAPPAVSSSPAGATFTIPWPIVQCESGGQNLPPNSAGASGYYQIIPDTWKGYGGSTGQAYQAPKSEQDQVAARIWDGGSGAHNWVCAALVGIT